MTKLLIFIPKAFGIEGARYHAIQSRGSGGFGLGFILGLETGPGAIITGIIGGVAGGIIGEEAVKSFFR